MSQRRHRIFTDEHKAEAVRIVEQSGQSIAQVAREMDLTESALRNWVKQAHIDRQQTPQGALTTDEGRNCFACAATLNGCRSSATS